MQNTTICLLFGGQNSEHEVSITSAVSIIKAINHKKFTVIPIWINKTGNWLWIPDIEIFRRCNQRMANSNLFTGKKCIPVILDYTHHKSLLKLDNSTGFFEPFAQKIDVFFPIIHGLYGEDGTIQGLLELSGVPYVGCGVLASAAGLDKVAMKYCFQQAGLPVCEYIHFSKQQWQENKNFWCDEIHNKLGFPCFVKPANGGSSVGVSRAKTPLELPDSVEKALQHDRKILVEKSIDARELECAVLGNSIPQASTIGEITPDHDFYDYESKYVTGESKIEVPADISQDLRETLREMSIKAFQALDCRGFSRVDFLVDKQTEAIYINEINTIPGFTSMSMFPMLWENENLSYPELISKLVELALERE